MGNLSTEVYDLESHKQIIRSQSARSQSKDFAEFATCIAYSILKLQRQRQDPHYTICKKCLVDKEKVVLHFNTAGHWVDISASSSEQCLMLTARGDSQAPVLPGPQQSCKVLDAPTSPSLHRAPKDVQASLAICRTKEPRKLCNATNHLSSSPRQAVMSRRIKLV